MRVVPNLYPAFEGDEPFVVANRGPVFTQATAGGIHEILIFSPEHDATWGMLSEEQTSLVMAALRDRLEEHAQRPNLRYTQAIVNSGTRGRGLAGTPPRPATGHVVHPPRAGRGTGALRPLRRVVPLVHHHRGRGGLGAAGDLRRRSGGGDLPLLECRALRNAGHTPRALPHLHKSPTPDLLAVGEAIRRCLGRLAEAVGDVAYNIVFHSAPYRAGEPYHWHAHIWPKATTTAGFELGTGVAINVVSPEEAASTLKVLRPDPLARPHAIGPVRKQPPDCGPRRGRAR